MEEGSFDGFTPEQIERMKVGQDSRIDDPELLTTKKALMDKFTPMSVINSIHGKHKDLDISKKDSVRKNPDSSNSMLFSFYITISDLNV